MRVLIEFDNKPLLFQDPVCIIQCSSAENMPACFGRIERYLDGGFHVAGFVSYEAGYALEPKLKLRDGTGFPLLCFGCYRAPIKERPPLLSRTSFGLNNVYDAMSSEEYRAGITRIRSYIEAGEVYQITFCRKLKFEFSGDAYRLYRTLLQDHPVPYPAYVEAGQYRILSLSPEMFIQKKGTAALTRPMKGSWPCGKGWIEDWLAGYRLTYDPKNRSENVMIADLLRNDLGRIGTRVRVERLFEVARYRTLWQMTSTVAAELPKEVPLAQLFGALFPSGSVTGAPKVRAMEIIRKLEREERRIHTGAIGYITPSRDLFFNVPIRTVLLDGTQGELGVGGGIVWDSTPEGEWAESEWKARFFTRLKLG